MLYSLDGSKSWGILLYINLNIIPQIAEYSVFTWLPSHHPQN